MKIAKGDKTINIPGWALVVGVLVVDNIVVNICKTVSYKNLCETTKNEKEES